MPSLPEPDSTDDERAAESAEEAQIRRAQAGDRQAMGQLLLEVFDPLVAHVGSRIPPQLQGQLSAEDIVQQTFARGFVEVGRFQYRGPGSLLAWLKTIAEHRLIDHIRAQMRAKRGGDRVAVAAHGTLDAQSAIDLLQRFAGDEPTASHIMRHREATLAMQVAIAALPADYQQVIQLRFIEGLSIRDTASRMQRTEAAVRALADRGKKLLRAQLGSYSAYLSSRGAG